MSWLNLFPSPFIPADGHGMERDTEEIAAISITMITEDDCCWCFPGTCANSICSTHTEEVVAQTPTEHTTRRNRH